jgi:tetratricopeptide (TPR) repeat protein
MQPTDISDPLPEGGLSLERSDAEDNALAKRSQALHSFIVGNLALDNQRIPDAIKAFEEARSGKVLADEAITLELVKLYLLQGEVAKARALTEELAIPRLKGAAGTLFPADRGILVLYAGVLEAAREPTAAIEIYRRLLELFPKDARVNLALASLLLQQGANGQAIDLLQGYLDSVPDDRSALLYLAHAYEASGEAVRGVRLLKTKRALWTEDERLPLDYVRLLLKDDDVKTVRQELPLLEQRIPQSTVIRQLRELFDNDRADDAKAPQRAQAILASLIEVPGSPKDLKLRLALGAMEQNRLESATDDLLLVLAADPNDSRARYYLATAFAASERQELALRELMKISHAQEMFVEARTFASFLYREKRDLVAAKNVLREALSVRPIDLTLNLYLIDALRDLGEYEEANDAISEALTYLPKSEELLFLRATVLHEQGERKEAIEAMETFLSRHPTHSQALNFIAYDLAETGKDLERARALIDKALISNPDDGFFLDTLGWILFKSGKLEEAAQTSARAVALTGEDPIILEHHGMILLAQGQIVQAVPILQNALKAAQLHRDSDAKAAAKRLKALLKKLDR